MKPWSDAKSFAELCDINIRLIRGQIDDSPNYGPLDPESNEIAEFLVALNRRGFLTTQSQPAADLGPYKQRAWVEGFASKDLALEIGAKELYSDLRIEFFPLTSVRFFWMPISQDEGKAFTWQGTMDPKDSDLVQFSKVCHPSAVAELQGKWYVTAIDPVWGRKDYLWEVLSAPAREGFSATARPEEEEEGEE